MVVIREWLARLQNHQAPVTQWAAQRRDEAAHLLGKAKESGDWIALTIHYNGFIREVAIRALRDQPSPEALVALIERLNDWVPQIRDLATESLNHYLSPSHVQALLFALEPLMALASRHRADHGPTLRAVRNTLQATEVHSDVYANFLARQGSAARYLFKLLLEKDIDKQTLLRDALAHRELTVRVAGVAACQALPDAQALQLLREALPRPGAKVRVCVMRALLPLLENPQPLLCAALLDDSRSIRSLARWVAPKHDIDARAILAGRLTEAFPKAKRGWLGILGLAAELDVELEQRWLMAAARSNYPTVRQAAMGQLSEGQSVELFAALDDPSDTVFLAAVAQLNKQSWASLHTGLDAKLDRDWHELSDKRRHALMRLRPKWQQVAYLLARLTTEPTVQVFWAKKVNLWCEEQYQIVDPVTSRSERGKLIEQLRGLASEGLISSTNFARISK
ncbi:PBS lyase [Pseudomonas sp. TH39(2020)]|uniref:PBS lyase n=1 Tax=Pseudomonas mandelii TaxID=75612 RepID=A0A502IAA2_9PSED|nr:PBS lyase [Pseudomonas mandelii]MBK5400786.1 PBS lyase [Pseudomonas sp. TH39(2020)]TPG82586.1 PBS lyase [Pseudomonas mandelii]